MGQANKRGNFRERQAFAIARNESLKLERERLEREAYEKMNPAQRLRYDQLKLQAAKLIALSESIGLKLPRR